MRTWLRIAAAVLSVAVLVPHLIASLRYVSEPGNVTGWEAAWIAQSLVDGHGFSFPELHRWLFEKVDTGRYFLTAWVDPIYTYCLAGLMLLFGPAHPVAAVWLNAIFLLSAFAFLYLSAERWFSPYAGLIVIALIGGVSNAWAAALDDENNTCLATLLISACFWQALRLFERPTAQRAIALGLLLGLTALGSPSTLLFSGATALVIATAVRLGHTRWRNALLVCIFAGLAMLPWTLRNYEVFGRFIPVRDGGGMLAFVGTVSLASVVQPELVPTRTRVDAHADTLREAVNLAQGRDERRALEKFPLDYALEVDPQRYAELDEARRDAWLGEQARAFARAHPGFVLAAALPKLGLFLRVLGPLGRITLIMAAFALIPGFRHPRARLAGAWIAAFAAPFGLIICYFNRYRAPVEPVVMLLALWGLWHAAAALRVRIAGAGAAPLANGEAS